MAPGPITVQRRVFGSKVSKFIARLGRDWRSLAAPGLLLLLGLGFALVPLARGEIFFYWDNAAQHYPQTLFLHDALRSGGIPHWWPQVGSGVPTVAEGQAAHYHPIRLLLAFLFDPPAALMTEIGVYLAVAGLSTYFFLREFRLLRSACVVGGLAQMFGSWSVIFIRSMGLHRSSCLLPLAMLFAERFVTGQKLFYGVAASLVLGLQLLAGNPTFVPVTIVATSFYIVCRVVQRCWHVQESFQKTVRALARAMLGWGLSVILGIGISAIQFIPTLLHGEQSIRQGGLSFEHAVAVATKAKYLLPLFFPYIYQQGDWFEALAGDGSLFNFVPLVEIYVGTLPVFLVFLSFWWHRHWPDPGWPLAVCCVLAIGFAMGRATPLYPALWSVLGMNGMRHPARFLLWASFCLSCLAALGLQRLLAFSRLGSRQVRSIPPFFLFGGLVLLVGLLLWTQRTWFATVANSAQDFHAGLITSLVLFAIALCLAAALLVARRRYRGLLVAGVVFFVFIDLWFFRVRSGYAPTVPIRDVMTAPPVVKFLQADQDRFRVMSLKAQASPRYTELFEFLQPDTPAIWGIESADAFFSLHLKRYHAVHEGIVWELLNSPEAGEQLAGFLGALNVKYVVASKSVNLRGWKKVYETAHAITWENRDFLPRAFLVGKVVPEKIDIRPEWALKAYYQRLGRYHNMVSDWSSRREDAQIVDNILSQTIDYRSTAIVAGEGLPQLSGIHAMSTVRMATQQPDVMAFEIQSGSQALLVISNNYYPGWTATVNGEPGRIYRTNYVGMGVLVPTGQSKVVLRFVTPGFRLGAVVSFLSLGLALGGLIVARRLQWTPLWDLASGSVSPRRKPDQINAYTRRG